MHILLTTIESDSHTWNLVVLQLLLQEQGHKVTNLGACVSPLEVIKQSNKLDISVIFVSTLNGHGSSEGITLAKQIKKQKKLKNIPLVIGGLLTTTNNISLQQIKELEDAGYSYIFNNINAPNCLSDLLMKLSPKKATSDNLYEKLYS